MTVMTMSSTSTVETTNDGGHDLRHIKMPHPRSLCELLDMFTRCHHHLDGEVDSVMESKAARMKKYMSFLPLFGLSLFCTRAMLVQDYTAQVHRQTQENKPSSAGGDSNNSKPKFTQQEIEKATPYFHYG